MFFSSYYLTFTCTFYPFNLCIMYMCTSCHILPSNLYLIIWYVSNDTRVVITPLLLVSILPTINLVFSLFYDFFFHLIFCLHCTYLTCKHITYIINQIEKSMARLAHYRDFFCCSAFVLVKCENDENLQFVQYKLCDIIINV